MTLKIYNSLTKKKEDFKTVEKSKVKMYVCGMTVYSDAHIGHARTYFAFDVIRRYFEYKGYNVTYVQNITDVDDKIINAANQDGVDALDYSKRFTEKCLGDLDSLGIRRADKYPKASTTIPDMIKLTKKIIDKDIAYESDGDVYFSVEKFPEYGKLSGQKLDDLMSGTHLDPGDKKRNPFDFALWKAAKPGEPSWDSPWGKGRPGWHIECSAMSSKFLGLPFDIHGGGMDLRFPHHENEIAQAEAATGKDFAKYWMHIGLLTVDGEKMSKSIGNIINVKDLLKKWDSEVIRFFFSQTHYRSPPDFSEKALENSKKGLNRIYRVKEKLEECAVKKETQMDTMGEEFQESIDTFKKSFEIAMDDDFNTPQAVGTIFNFVNTCNRYFEKTNKPNSNLCKKGLETLIELSNILTLFQDKKENSEKIDTGILKQLRNVASEFVTDIKDKTFDELIDYLLEAREKARKDKDWKTADSIREKIGKIGFEIQDTDKGPVWRKK
jgi:cysteinyl-tRNA synthetase